MTQAAFLQPGEGETLSIVGEVVRVLADSASTGGACFVFEETTRPGGGPPLHTHAHEDEFFFVAEGVMKFVVDGRESIVPAGGFAVAPRGSVHSFRNEGDAPSRMVITCIPAGLEAAFRAADDLERAGRASPEALADVFRPHGVEFVGPPLEP